MFSKFVERLGLSEQHGAQACHDKYDISRVALIDGNTGGYGNQTLYFGYSAQLDEKGELPPQCILADDSGTHGESYGTDVVFVDQASLFSLFNKAMEIIGSLADIDRLYDELMGQALESKSLEAFVNAAAAKVGNSLILLDLSFKILAHSTIYQINDRYWAENIKNGYCSYEFISAVMELDSIKNAPETREAVEVTCTSSPYKKLSSKVYRNGVRVGTLLMLEKDTPIRREHMELMGIISRAAGDAVALIAPHYLSQVDQYQQLLYDLLIGATEPDVHSRISTMHFPDKMFMLYIRPTRYLSKNHLQENVVMRIKELLPGVHVTHYLEGIAALVPAEATVEFRQNRADIERLCIDEHVRLGVSNEFDSIFDVSKHYAQAAKALEIDSRLRKDSPLCFYVDYLFHDLMDLFSDAAAPGRFCHPALSLLSRYDHKHGTELYRTLKAYLQCSCNNKETAAKLFIHRNSLAYRMEKIIELTGIDLSDSNIRFILFMSYEIDRHNGKDF